MEKLKVNWAAIATNADEAMAELQHRADLALNRADAREEQIRREVDSAVAGIPAQVKRAVLARSPRITVYSWDDSTQAKKDIGDEVARRLREDLEKAGVRVSDGAGEKGWGSGYELYADVAGLILIAGARKP